MATTIQTAQSNQSDKYHQAVSYFKKGDYDRAGLLLAECLLEGQTSERWNDWATAKFLSGRAAEAEGGYRRALEMDPENSQAIANLGALLAGQKRYSEAIPLLEFSVTRGGVDPKGATGQLLEACKEAVAGRAGDKAGELVSLCQSLTKGLSLQTVSVDRVLFRQMNFEADMRQYANRCLTAVEEMRAHMMGPKGTPKLIPTVPITDICPELPAVEVHAPIVLDGNVSLYELVVISSLVRASRARDVFEFGTFDGRTTLNMAANLSGEGRVFTLDLPRTEMKKTSLALVNGEQLYIDKECSGARFAGTKLESRITQLYGDSAKFDYSPFDGQIDFVFVDASHSYPYVLNDSRKALSLLRKGKGTILWHDYPGWPGVANALHELFLKDSAFRNLRNIENTSFGCLQV